MIMKFTIKIENDDIVGFFGSYKVFSSFSNFNKYDTEKHDIANEDKITEIYFILPFIML